VPQTIISDRGVTFNSKLFKAFMECLGCSSILSTAFHPETNGQTERVNSILKTYLRLFVNYNQDDWASKLDLAEFAYNNAKQSSAQCSPFFANYGFNPSFTVIPGALRSTNVPDAKEGASYIKDIQNELILHLEAAAEKMKLFADVHRGETPTFVMGQLVYLRTKNIKTTRPSQSLDYRFLGPFPIIKICGSHAYQLKLDASMNIHDVFHVSLLSSRIPNPIEGRIEPPPLPTIIDSEQTFTVEEVLAIRVNYKKLEVFVKWTGYEEKTWEPIAELKDTIASVRFEQENQWRVKTAYKKWKLVNSNIQPRRLASRGS
jgi:hypothetical protein